MAGTKKPARGGRVKGGIFRVGLEGAVERVAPSKPFIFEPIDVSG